MARKKIKSKELFEAEVVLPTKKPRSKPEKKVKVRIATCNDCGKETPVKELCVPPSVQKMVCPICFMQYVGGG